MMNEEPMMNEEQAGEAVARYLEQNPELLDGIAPSLDLWPAIENRISARVLPLESTSRNARGARRGYGWIPMLIAASALVATSAGITYELASRPAPASSATSEIAGRIAIAPVAGTSGGSESGDSNVGAATANAAVATAATDPGNTSRPPARVPSAGVERGTSATSRLASAAAAVGGDESRSTYDAEIATLHDAVEARRSQLNPKTVAIIEQNLRVINEAIRQSRAALAKDPDSRLLNDQLDRTLAKKTGLLRAAALLPAA